MDDLGFDNPKRKLLYGYILDHPGSTFQMLMQVIGFPESTLRYHLNFLERKKKIVYEKKNGQVHYFSTIGDAEKNISGIRFNELQEKILDLITKEPGITKQELLIRTRTKTNSLDLALRKLRENKFIWKRNTLNGQGFERITKELIKEEVYLFLVDKLLKGEIDKKEFNSLKSILNEL